MLYLADIVDWKLLNPCPAVVNRSNILPPLATAGTVRARIKRKKNYQFKHFVHLFIPLLNLYYIISYYIILYYIILYYIILLFSSPAFISLFIKQYSISYNTPGPGKLVRNAILSLEYRCSDASCVKFHAV